jgi:U3 small nucleolar RNA-associated protein 12
LPASVIPLLSLLTASVQAGGRRLGAVCSRTLTMTEEVLAACFSPDGRFLAVALMDHTIKVFFADSLKFYLSLYGHKVRFSSFCFV